MLEILLERPVTIGVIGAIVSIATFYAWIQTGIKHWLPTAISLAIATVVLIVLSVTIETEQEILRRFVYETAKELQTNQYQRVIAKIHPQATESLQEARLRLPQIEFTAARIKTIHEIQVKRNRTGSTAIITMNAYIEAGYGDRHGRAPRWVQLTLERVNDTWLMVDFEQREPHYGALNSQGQDRLDSIIGR